MENEELKSKNFFAGGYLYNPDTREILLHLRDGNTPFYPNTWSIFGGGSEGDETPEECCVREWREELGITVSPEDLIPITDYFNELRQAWRYAFYMESRLKKSEMTLGEGADFDWVPLDKVLAYNLSPLARHDLETLLKKL